MNARSALVLLALLVLPAAAFAQSTFGSIVGVTQDSTQALMPEAKVTVRNLDDNTGRSTVSDGKGAFQFLNLKPGRYRIVAKKAGFSDFTLAEVRLDARQALRVQAT